jgi:PST family polysaccharide transporter
MSLSQRTIKAGSWQLAAVVIKAVLQLVVLGVLARYVLPKAFGLIAMANMVMVFVDMFADAGIGPAIIQKKELSEPDIRAAFLLSVVFGIFFVAALWFAAPLVSVIFKTGNNVVAVIRWIGISALITKVGIISRSRLEREMRFDILMWIDVGSYLFGYALVGIVMAVLDYGVWAIVVAKIAQCTLQTICLLIIRPNSVVPVFSGKIYKELVRYGGGLTLTRVFDSIASQGDYFIVGRYLGSAALGFYDRASSLSSMPGQYLNVVLDKTLFPAMAQVQDKLERLKKAYIISTNIVCTLLVPLTALILIIAPEIIGLILGPNWGSAIKPFRILTFVLVCRILINISDTLVRATGAVYASAFRKAILATLIVFGSWVGQHWGLSGVAIAVDGSLLIGFLMMLQLSLKILGCKLTECVHIYGHGLLLGLIVSAVVLPMTLILRLYSSAGIFVIGSTVASSALIIFIIAMTFPKLFGKSVCDFWEIVSLMIRSKRTRTG